MSERSDQWAEQRRRRSVRENVHLYIRHDAWRFMPPGAPRYSGRDVVKYFEPEFLAGKWAARHDAPAAPETSTDRAFAAELRELRGMLTELRFEWALRKFAAKGRKYSPDQPRAPAGSPEGGQWTSGTGPSASPVGKPTTTDRRTIHDRTGQQSWKSVTTEYRPDGSVALQTILNRDGSKIHSEFSATPHVDGWDNRHTVTLPDGSVTTFQNSGLTQTILDEDGQQLARSTWTKDGPDPEATVQRAFLPAVPPAVAATVEAAAALYVWLSNRNGPDSTAVFAHNSVEFRPGANAQAPVIHTRELTRDQVDEACPRYSEVQTITKQAVSSTEHSAYQSPQAYGTAIHQKVKEEINGPTTYPESPPRDPNFRAETSTIKSNAAGYGVKGSIRVDVLENPGTGTVCVYDIKTGDRGLSVTRMRELASSVSFWYPGTRRIIVTEVRADP